MYAQLVRLSKKPRVIGCKEIFKKTGESLLLKKVWCRFVELRKILV